MELTLAEQFGIDGIVRDEQGDPVANATVQVYPVGQSLLRAGRTDAEGQYAIDNLPAGTYDLVLGADGFASRVVTNVALAGNLSMPVTLDAAASSLSGQIRDSAGTSIAAVDVTVLDEMGYQIGAARSGQDGRFTVTGVAGSNLTIVTTAYAYATHTVTGVTVAADQQHDVGEIVMQLTSLGDPNFWDLQWKSLQAAGMPWSLIRDEVNGFQQDENHVDPLPGSPPEHCKVDCSDEYDRLKKAKQKQDEAWEDAKEIRDKLKKTIAESDQALFEEALSNLNQRIWQSKSSVKRRGQADPQDHQFAQQGPTTKPNDATSGAAVLPKCWRRTGPSCLTRWAVLLTAPSRM